MKARGPELSAVQANVFGATIRTPWRNGAERALVSRPAAEQCRSAAVDEQLGQNQPFTSRHAGSPAPQRGALCAVHLRQGQQR